jgi:tetraacyldisaccharide 4'-kinase
VLRRPVVSVGNLAMGGRGKTPVVAHLARALLAAGLRPAILSRGYARRQPVEGVVVVSDGAHLCADLARSGDEPLMLARDLPGAIVLVSPDRTLAATLAEQVLGADVHVLDDGFQHRRLARDVDVVVIAPQDLTARRLPFGPLREDARALRRAHAVVLDGGSDAQASSVQDVIRRYTTAPVFPLHRRLGEPVPLEPGRGWPATRPRVIAVAGIAAPERFGQALRAANWDVARVMAFRDHHPYDASDVRRIAAALQDTGAAGVLTTSKDAVRLLPQRPLPMPVAAVPLGVDVGVDGEFERWLLHQVREARP